MRQIEMADAAEDHGLDLTNKQKVTEFLRSQVSFPSFDFGRDDDRTRTLAHPFLFFLFFFFSGDGVCG